VSQVPITVWELTTTVDKYGFTLQEVYKQTSLQAFYQGHTTKMMPPKGSVWLPCLDFKAEAQSFLKKGDAKGNAVNKVLLNSYEWHMMVGPYPEGHHSDWREISLATAEANTDRFCFEWVRWLNVAKSYMAIRPKAEASTLNVLGSGLTGYVSLESHFVKKLDLHGLPEPLSAALQSLRREEILRIPATV
jgi:hypothetical protein